MLIEVKSDTRGGLMAVSRTMKVLEAIAAAPEGISLARLAVAVGAPKTSLVELLQTLVGAQYLRRDGVTYRYGPMAFRLAGLIQQDRSFEHDAHAWLEKLSRETDETAVLVTLAADRRTTVYADTVIGANPVRYMPVHGELRPAHLTAGGRLILAYQGADQIEAYLRDVKLQAVTAETVTTKARLRQLLQAIRRQGHAETYGELIEGGASIAAPVFQATGEVAAALVLGGPAERFKSRSDTLVALVREAATAMSRQLGYDGDGSGPR